MLSKTKKILILVGMVALLVLTGCLNIFLNRTPDLDDVGKATGNFFVTYRADRQATREQTLLYLDAIINNESSSEQAVANAEASKLELTKSMELELVLEGLIKALGFEDAVVTTSSESISVIIKSPELQSNEVTQICDVITTETGKEAINVRIIPV